MNFTIKSCEQIIKLLIKKHLNITLYITIIIVILSYEVFFILSYFSLN